MTIPPEAAVKFNMLSAGDKVLVALSGGADSVCLLHCLASNAEKLGISVCAAHYNHRLRGGESERDAAFALRICKELKIPFLCGSGVVAKEAEKLRMSTEECARKMRYEFLEDAAKILECNKIATAHNADDNAETILLNLTRGSGARGLSGIPPVRGNIIRPLLMTTREEIEAYLEEYGLLHVEDSSNRSDDYTRNVIRHKVMPVLKLINPAFSAAAMRASENLRQDEKCLEEMAESFMGEHLEGDSLPVCELKKLPEAVASRVFRGMCGRSLSAQHCEAIFKLLEGTELAFSDVNGMRITRDSGRLYFGTETQKLGSYELPLNGEIFVPELNAAVKTQIIENCSDVSSSVYKFDFKYSSICGNISLTPRREGDKIRLAYRGCTKSLKDLFSEKKMSRNERSMTPVFRDEKGVMAVAGFGIAERCSAEIGDTVLRAEIIKKNSTGDNLKK